MMSPYGNYQMPQDERSIGANMLYALDYLVSSVSPFLYLIMTFAFCAETLQS
jgi:hypothetical protein